MTEWNLHCRTCNETHELAWHADGDKQITTLIPHLPAIAALTDLIDAHIWPLDMEDLKPMAPFARKHLGHDLAPIDEYGRFVGDCWVRLACSCCKSSLGFCRLPTGHTGDHSPHPPKDPYA